MLKRVIGLATGLGASSVVLAPTAFAQDKYAHIYDEDPVQPLPGTTKAPAQAENAVAQISAKIDENINTVETDGHILRYNKELTDIVGTARSHTERLWAQFEAASQRAYNGFFDGERSVSKTLASLKGEELLPGSVCVLVATLSGSIAARRRNILLRAVTPLVFGTAAFAYFLPNTFANTSRFAYKLERENYPALADAQDRAQESLQGAKREAATAVEQGESSLKRWVHEGRTAFERFTGVDFSGTANK